VDASGQYICQQNSTRAVFPVQQHKRYRYRLINTGAFTPFDFSIDNHTLSVIEADGTVVQPINVHRLQVAVAQRYSVVLNANQTASNYWIRSQMDTFCFATDNPALDPDVRALLTYTNSTEGPTLSSDWLDAVDDLCEDFNATLLVPSVAEEAPPAQTLYAIQFSFEIGDYALDRAYVNGTSWIPADVPTLNQAVEGLKANNNTFNVSGLSSAYTPSNQYVIDIPRNQVVDLLVTNFDDGSHPFHLHGHRFWIMAASDQQYFDWDSYGSINTTNPIRRDTLTIDANGWALIRFRSDNPGLWALHCHISWHMEAGLLIQFQARNDIMKDWTLPESVTDLCKV
jgi:FtsP/CotA-like multicopper oxidase with cupredoxin domain